MKKVFLDTNILLRFLLKDNKQMHADCVKIVELIQVGKLKPYFSSFVVLELIYILTKVYKKDKGEVLKKISTLLTMRNLVLVEKTNTSWALELYSKHNIKIGDCFIATQVPDGVAFLTYDREFGKLDFLSLSTPENFSI